MQGLERNWRCRLGEIDLVRQPHLDAPDRGKPKSGRAVHAQAIDCRGRWLGADAGGCRSGGRPQQGAHRGSLRRRRRLELVDRQPCPLPGGPPRGCGGTVRAIRTVTIEAPTSCTVEAGDTWRVYNGYALRAPSTLRKRKPVRALTLSR